MVAAEQAPCPDDARVAAFVEHAMEASERDAFEVHVHACASCRETLGHVIAIGQTMPASGSSSAPAPGETVGRFALIDVLGVGGMGVVYSAHDPELDRNVAIKFLRTPEDASGSSDAPRQRLLREAQALAKIDHPNVIKVHDVGSHDGQVYIAMELADAGSLRAWLASGRHTASEIVEVFVHAGRGLAAAHDAGLVHRDIKPDNVLMFRGGRICVTDFGLAGVDPGREVPETSSPALTRTGAVIGTPLYMAPEQFEGRPATAASDQFSFCVALHEAVYGAHPYGGTTFSELSASVTRGELAPVPAGARVPAWLRRVLVRGVARDPSARFASMAALLDELVRVRARRRRRIATGVLAAVAIGTAGLAVGLRHASALECGGGEREVAAVWSPARRLQLEAAFLSTRRPHAAETFEKVAALLDTWAQRWSAGHVDACAATRVRGEQSEHVLDLRVRCLGDRLGEVGATVDVLAAGGGVAVDHALDAALHLPSLESCARPPEPFATVAPPDGSPLGIEVHAVRSRVDRANAELELGHYAAARDVANGALVAARGTADRPSIANAVRALGEAQLKLADRGALDSFRESVHVARAIGDTATEVAASAGLVIALTTLSGKYEVALEVAELADAAAASMPASPALLIELDDARGDLELARGKPAAARARYEQAVARGEKALGPDHVAVLTSLERLGNALKVQGKFDDARRLYERVLTTRQRIEAPDHPDVASVLDNLGNVARAQSRLDEAQRLYERALAIRVASLGPDHPAVADSYDNLGAFEAERGDPAGARRYFDQAIALDERVDGADSVELAGALTNLGSSLVVAGDFDAATKALVRARTLFEAKLGPDDLHVAYVMSELGVIAERKGQLDDALERIRGAERIAAATQGADHPDYADYLEREASVLTSQHKFDEAEPILVRAIQIYRNAYGAEHPRVAMGLGALGQLQGQRGDYRAALASWQQALPIFEATLPKDHPNLSFALAGIGDALTELGRAPEALPYLEHALAIRVHAKMPPALVAEIHFYLAAALVASPQDHARALTEARTALAMYSAAGDDDDVRELRTWLAKH